MLETARNKSIRLNQEIDKFIESNLHTREGSSFFFKQIYASYYRYTVSQGGVPASPTFLSRVLAKKKFLIKRSNGISLYVNIFVEGDTSRLPEDIKYTKRQINRNVSRASNNKNKRDLNVKQLKDHLKYVEETGEFIWIVTRGRSKEDSRAGTSFTTKDGNTYRVIKLLGFAYLTTHLVILCKTNSLPPTNLVVDHINGDTLDNRFSNLRVCTNQENAMNIHKGRGKYSKYKGVSYDKRDGFWVASIGWEYKVINLGRFTTELEAAEAYDMKAKDLYGDFANLNFKKGVE